MIIFVKMMTLRKTILPILFSISMLFSLNVFAGDPPPVGGDPTNSGGEIGGGGAPIGGGLFLLIGLGAAYAGRKTLQLKDE